jgi:amino acid permease
VGWVAQRNSGTLGVKTTILAWSAVSGLVLGLFSGILLFAVLVLGGELLPGVVPRLGGRARLAAALLCFVLIPFAGAALGWMEGRLKLR